MSYTPDRVVIYADRPVHIDGADLYIYCYQGNTRFVLHNGSWETVGADTSTEPSMRIPGRGGQMVIEAFTKPPLDVFRSAAWEWHRD